VAEGGEGKFGGVEKIVDRVNEFLERVHELTGTDVLVGVPESKNHRKDGPVTNSQIARIHEFGSPAQNIPARPFLRPGLKAVREKAVEMLKEGAKQALEGKGNMEATMTKVGILARNSVINAITDPAPPFAPLKPATIRARLRRTAAGRRKIKQLRAKGQSLESWASQTSDDGTMNIRPLLDTLQLRAAISFVLVKEGERAE
jgi:hypothetical protein